MRYLLDTNVWIQHLKHASSRMSVRLKQTPAAEIAVCSIVWAEMLLTVVTNNGEFHRVDGLRIEDWSVV